MVAATSVSSPPTALVSDANGELETRGDETVTTIVTDSEPKIQLVSEGSSICTSDNENNKDEQKQQQQSKQSSLSPPQKAIMFNDATKKPPRMTSIDDYTMLPEGYFPKDEDVICSWARQNHSHPGNEKFRLMINQYAPAYLNVSTKYQKSEVIAKIVAEVRSKSPGGGFVKKDFYSNRWFEVGDEKARDKVGHAIRKAATELGKKLRGGKRQQPQSLVKRRLKNKADEFDQVNSMGMNMNMNMNTANIFNKAALMNGMNIDSSFSGLPNDMGLSSMNGMNMNGGVGALNNLSGRNALMGVPNMARNASGLMNAMGMNGMGSMGMASNMQGSYSRELEEIMIMNRLRADLASGGAPADSSLLGNYYGNNGMSSGNSGGGLSGLNNSMSGMDDSAMIGELQRRRLRIGAAAKKEEAMNMLRESDQLSRWAEKNKSSSLSNSPTMDFNNANGSSGMNGTNNSNNNRTNPAAMNYMGMTAQGGAPFAPDNNNSNDLDAISTSTLLSKIAAGNSKMSDQIFMRGRAPDFGNNNNGMTNNHLMNNNNQRPTNNNNSMGMDNNMNDQLSNSNNGGLQSLNQFQEQYNYNMP